MALETASPYLALLNEPDYSLKEYALESLDKHVDQLWAEIADHITEIEELYEDEKFPAPQLAALVASKVYYNLGEFDASMKYALVAGDKFDLSKRTEYIETVISCCISHYISVSQKLYDLSDKELESLPELERTIDAKLTGIAEKMLKRCIENGDFRLALGVALEARRSDVIEAIIKDYSAQSMLENDEAKNDTLSLISYVLDCSVTVINNRKFRNKVLNTLVPIILELKNPDYFAISKIIVQLNDYTLATKIFKDLLGSKQDDDRLVAYQVAFDLVASASQELLEKVAEEINEIEGPTYSKLGRILSGVPTCDMNITFLQKHNNTDLSILLNTKNHLDGRNSIFHSAVSFQIAFLHAGTTADRFFRENLDWLGKATNWTKFAMTAAIGVIHQGNLSQGRKILKPYLPGESANGSPYYQGGGLYALGLVFAGHGREVIDYLRKHVVEGSSGGQGTEAEVILHGAALGVGVAGMGSGNMNIYEELRNVLFSDSAIAGEATGLSMGLVMLGSKNESAESEMLQYAHDTQHEKIIRSLAMGIALLNYAKEEAADAMIEQLIEEQDPILRYGGAFTIAMAYAGTDNNKAIKKLLHIAVSDANDDVRRASVMGLGFILLRNPTAVPGMVELLSESHNPHVRYGTALALGISCAGTGLKEAVEVLEPMLKDPVDFVRQGSMIALAMILIQQNEKLFPKVKNIHQEFAKVISAKHEDAMAKFGAALAKGIIDAGGRNVTISLEHRQTGNLNMKAVVGLAVFVQYWYWFPLAHFLSLGFTPTTIAAVREDLKIPQFKIDCHAKLKLFGYPPKVEESSEKAPEKLVTAILSTTVRAKNRARKASEAKKKQNENAMVDSDESDAEHDKEKKAKEEEEEEEEEEEANNSNNKMDVDKKEQQNSELEEDNDVIVDEDFDQFQTTIEKSSRKTYEIENMSRVLPAQLKYISFKEDHRFIPVRRFRGIGGVILVVDKTPKAKVEFIKTLRQINSPDEVDEEDEAPLPEPFIYADE